MNSKDFRISFGLRFRPDGTPEHWADVYPSASGSSLPYPVALRLERRHGRLVCTRLELGSPHGEETQEVTAASLRRVPLGQIMAAVAEALALHEELDRRTNVDELNRDLAQAVIEALDTDDLKAAQDATRRHTLLMLARETIRVPETSRSELRKRRGPRGRSDDFYARLADVYRQALLRDPRHPYRYVVEHFTSDDGSPFWPPSEHDLQKERIQARNEASARKLVYRARRRSAMGAGQQGKAGEYGPADHSSTADEEEAPDEDQGH